MRSVANPQTGGSPGSPAFARALELVRSGHAAEGEALLRDVLQSEPANADAAYLLGSSLAARREFAEAGKALRRAVELRRDFPAAWRALAHALLAQGDARGAADAFGQTGSARPDDVDALMNLAQQFLARGANEDAERCYRKVLEARPDFLDALNLRGFVLQEMGRVDEAADHYRRALAIDPGSVSAQYNLALARLAKLDFEAGWKLYEARFRTEPPIAQARAFAIPRLTAADWKRCRRLAIWPEQGIGDQILYMTAIPELEARGVDFVLEVDPRLQPAIARAHPRWRLVAAGESAAAFAECDFHIPLASLAALLRPSLESFPREPRALVAADGARSRSIRSALAERGKKLVGISWRSFRPKIRDAHGERKSASLAAFLALSRRDDVRLVDLQYGETTAERDVFHRVGGALSRIDGLDLYNDLDGVLAAIDACDRVITTSNVAAHLAGALGKATWLLYPGALPPFFYWAAGPDGRSLWYPSVEPLTDPSATTWARVFDLVEARLAR